MNKMELKKYFNVMKKNNKSKEFLTNSYCKCITDYNINDYGYLICNSVSLIKLNSAYDLEPMESDKLELEKIFNDFKMNYCLYDYDITSDILKCGEDTFKLTTDYSSDIKENSDIVKYCIDMKKVKNIMNIIKGNKITLKRKFWYGYSYLIMIENTITNEYAYLLPMQYYI